MRLKKSSIMISMLVTIVASVVGCSKHKENDENNEDNKMVVNESEISYRGLSGISTIAANRTFKYTEENMECQLFEWSDDVVLPVPKPEGLGNVEIVEHGLYGLSLDENEWLKYKDILEKEYGANVEYINVEGVDERYDVEIYNREFNYSMIMTWRAESDLNLRNSLYLWIYVGCQEKIWGMTNDDVLDKVKEKLNMPDGHFEIINISSPTNIEDGFGIYYISTTTEYFQENYVSNYLCVMRDGNVVLLDENVLNIGLACSAEFMETTDGWKLYAVKHEISSSNYPYAQLILEYTMKDEQLVKTNEVAVCNMADIENADIDTLITLKKNDNVIDMYEVRWNEKYQEDTLMPMYEQWFLGGKIGELDGSKIEQKPVDDDSVEK